jgi:hypothetical protein
MMKKFLLLVLVLLGAAVAYKVASDQRAKASLWAEITDRMPH